MTDTPTPRTEALAEKWSTYIVLDGPRPMEWITFARTLERDLAACRAALRELVACKDLKDRLAGSYYPTYRFDEMEYARRKPLAWSAARAILQSDEGETR